MIRIGNRTVTSNSLRSCELRCRGNYLKTLERDDCSCVLCGCDEYVMVHHLDGEVENSKMINLVTVCKRCHAELHGQTVSIKGPKVELIKELRANKMTFKEIGSYLGISRQRVHQIALENKV